MAGSLLVASFVALFFYFSCFQSGFFSSVFFTYSSWICGYFLADFYGGVLTFGGVYSFSTCWVCFLGFYYCFGFAFCTFLSSICTSTGSWSYCSAFSLKFQRNYCMSGFFAAISSGSCPAAFLLNKHYTPDVLVMTITYFWNTSEHTEKLFTMWCSALFPFL